MNELAADLEDDLCRIAAFPLRVDIDESRAAMRTPWPEDPRCPELPPPVLEDDPANLRDLLVSTKDLLMRAYRANYSVEQSFESGSLDPAEMVDCGILLREVARATDELRKSCNAWVDKIGEELCKRAVVSAHTSGGTASDTVTRGKLGSATPKLDAEIVPPPRGSEAETAFLRSMGVTDPGGIMKLSWTAVNDMATQLTREGIDLPVDKRVRFRSVFRKKRDI